MTPRSLSAFCLIVLALPLLFPKAIWAKQPGKTRPPSQSTCPNDLPTNPDSQNLEQFAQRLIGKLVTPSSPGRSQNPVWMNWADKCDVFGCNTAFNKFSGAKPARSQGQLVLSKLISSLEYPVQVQDSSTNNHADFPKNLLASVYYNCQASVAVKRTLTAEKQDRSAPVSLDSGSVIVKLIWNIQPTPTTSVPSSLISSTLNPVGEINWNPSLGTQLRRNNTDWRAFTLCPVGIQCNAAPGQAAMPLNRIYFVDLPRTQPSIPNSSPLGPGCHEVNCIAALVGINMMVRTIPKGEWIWISLWWTGNHHDNGLPAPWDGYELAVTNSDRMPSKSPSQMEIVFNPYLEGLSQQNGRVSNCRTCHVYAALAKDPSDQVRLHAAGTDTSHGDPPPLRSPTSIPSYLKVFSATQTDLVWSLARTAQ